MRKDFYIEVFEHIFGDGRKVFKASVSRKMKFWFDDSWNVVRDGNFGNKLIDSDSYSSEYSSLDEAKEAVEEAIEKHIQKELKNKLVQVRKVYP